MHPRLPSPARRPRLALALILAATAAIPSLPALALQSTSSERLLLPGGPEATQGQAADPSLLASSKKKNKNKNKKKNKGSNKKSSDDKGSSSKSQGADDKGGKSKGSDDKGSDDKGGKGKGSDDKSRSSARELSLEVAALGAQPLPLF